MFDEGCFFCGEDLINVIVVLFGIKVFNIEMFELGEDVDIYNCFILIKVFGVVGEDEIK